MLDQRNVMAQQFMLVGNVSQVVLGNQQTISHEILALLHHKFNRIDNAFIDLLIFPKQLSHLRISGLHQGRHCFETDRVNNLHQRTCTSGSSSTALSSIKNIISFKLSLSLFQRFFMLKPLSQNVLECSLRQVAASHSYSFFNNLTETINKSQNHLKPKNESACIKDKMPTGKYATPPK